MIYMNSVLSPGDILFMITSNTKYNFIIGQCALAEIMCHGFERKLLVNTGWPIYKVQSV